MFQWFHFQLYQSTLQKPEEFNATIELLETTSKLILILQDKAPIVRECDERLNVLRSVATYFSQFKGKDPKLSLTRETAYDVLCTVNGLVEFITICCKKKVPIIPAYINSDIIENHFCMVRTLFNGANDNPNYYTYKSLQNSIILTRSMELPSKRNSNTYIEPPTSSKVCKPR